MGEHEEKTAQVARARRQWSLGSALIVVAAFGAVLVAGFMTYRSGHLVEQRDVAQEQVSTEVQRKQQYVDRALALCDPADPVAVEKLRTVGLCDLAREDEAQPTVQQVAPEVPFSTVLAAVEAYLSAHPPKDGRTPTREELLALAQEVFKANPPKDGETPSREDLLELVEEVYAANPPAPGKDGVDGRPGDKGDQGLQGPGVQSLDLVERDGRCLLVVVFEKFADGRQTPSSEREVRPELCYTPPPSSGPPVVPTN
jgi:hypothetical protein